jgi:hypothetical protein
VIENTLTTPEMIPLAGDACMTHDVLVLRVAAALDTARERAPRRQRYSPWMSLSLMRSRRLGIDMYGRSIYQHGTMLEDGMIEWHPVAALPAPRAGGATPFLDALRRVAGELGADTISSHTREERS